MSRTVLLVHGSPGAASELAPLRAAFVARGLCVEALRMPIADAAPMYGPLVDAARGADLIVSYSYGCYLTLLALEAGALAAGPLCLVSPHLIAPEGLSAPVAFLLGMPGLGLRLISAGLDKRADEYLTRVFAPAPVPASLRRELLEPSLWLRAARWKQQQARHPLRSIDPRKLPACRVVTGTDDVASPWREHASAFSPLLSDALVTRVEGAGHALAWTHPERVVDAALSLFEAEPCSKQPPP